MRTFSEDYENVKRAASFNSEITYPSLLQHLEYRKRVAQRLLHEPDPQTKDVLLETFKHLSATINNLIGQ